MSSHATFDITGRSALVVGASSGIGRRFARVLAASGANVTVAARRRDRLDELCKELPNVHAATCDVTDPQQCEDVVEQAVNRWDGLDILVNSAGISRPQKVEAETPEAFTDVLRVNLVGLFATTRAAGIAMQDRGGGTVINVASIVGLVGIGRMPQASYAASKGGVVALTREMAAQWARKGIRVNAIAPGFFDTEMTSGLFGTEKGKAWVERLTPMGRGGHPHELDGVLLFLASDASTYVTGAVIPVDGGWTAV